MMCRRMVINAGLDKVVIRRSKTEFEVVDVQEWVNEDDLQIPAFDADAILNKM